MQPIILPAPYRGVDERRSQFAIEAPFCRTLFNWNTNERGVSVRFGDSKYKRITTAITNAPVAQAAYGNSKLLFIVANGSGNMEIFDVDTGTSVFTSASATGSDNFFPLFFNNYLFFLGPGNHSPGFYYNGSTYGVCGWTGSNFKPNGGCVYKNRAYIIQKDEPAYWYTQRDAISGAVTKVDLASVIEDYGTLVSIQPVSLSAAATTQSLLAFTFSTGEVLYFIGTYPDGEWEMIGRANIGQPIDYGSELTYNGDALILCDTGLVSLRNTFQQGGNQASTFSMSANVEASWRELIAAIRVSVSKPSGPIIQRVRAVFDDTLNRIVICVPFYLSSGTAQYGATFFIYDTLREAWQVHRNYALDSRPAVDIDRFKGKTLFIAHYNNAANSAFVVWEKEGASDFMDYTLSDSYIGYSFDLLSAPILNGRAYVQKIQGMDIIVETDLYDVTNYQLVGDFGRQSSGAQKLPNPGSGITKPFVNLGMESSFIQYRISGTTSSGKSTGLNLYSVNIWSDQGRSPR